MKKKFCFICGLPVPKNKSILNMPKIDENVRNREYWYICNSCQIVGLRILQKKAGINIK